ncbi:MAG: hypothetical protein Q8L56_06275 [Rhodocyclaceae bacterium]|nr:hypothetical protein [Rhodocyclaceae bacterium]
MHKARLLADLNRQILEAYSRRTTAALRARLPFPLALPWLDRLLLSNVEKEVRKDARVITCAAQAVITKAPADESMVTAMLHAARDIDRDFLSSAARTPLEIPIRYEAVNPVRIQRIRRLLEASWQLCDAWGPRRKLRAALTDVFPDAELERLIFELLVLYARETQVLGESVRMPALLSPLRRRVLAGLFETMEITAAALSREAAGRIRRTKRT